MEIVFCRTRYDYQSYTDFWRLVELSGFEVVWLDEMQPGRDAVYIVSPRNGELPGVLPRLQGQRACRFVWWCLERPDDQGSVTRGGGLEDGIDELWLSDRWLAAKHEANGWGPVRFVPFGSHPDLGAKPLRVHQFDWTHMSYANPRRAAVYQAIHGVMLPNAWDGVRDQGLRLTRLMVNVHQDDWPVFEPLRFALATAYGLPIVSEWSESCYPYLAILAPYDEVADRANQAIWQLREDPTGPAARLVEDVALRSWVLACVDFPFRRCVEAAVCG